MATTINTEEDWNKILSDMDEDERLQKEDPVRYACKIAEQMDLAFRQTFFKLQKGSEELLTIGDWVVDPEGNVSDIVHLCSDEFQSTTVLVPKVKRSNLRVLKHIISYREKFDLVCVTCTAKPTEDVYFVIELLTKRQENLTGSSGIGQK